MASESRPASPDIVATLLEYADRSVDPSTPLPPNRTSERDRHDAYEALQQTFGDHTDTVIELLRPDHERLATKDDLALLRSELQRDMADLRTEFRTDINTAFAAQTRTMVIGLISAVVLIALSNALAVLAG